MGAMGIVDGAEVVVVDVLRGFPGRVRRRSLYHQTRANTCGANVPLSRPASFNSRSVSPDDVGYNTTRIDSNNPTYVQFLGLG